MAPENGNEAAAAQATERVGELAQRTARDVSQQLTGFGVDALNKFADIAEKKGTWVTLFALGATMWLLTLGMEIRPYDEGFAALSTEEFIAAMAAGAFALALGTVLRVFALREMTNSQKETNASVSGVAQEAIDSMTDSANKLRQELGR
jgi:hypothetical protein